MADYQGIKCSAKYTPSGIKDAGVPGVLELSLERFIFIANDQTSDIKLNVDFKTIIGHKSTKEGSIKAMLCLLHDQGGGYMFGFDNFSERDVCRDFVAKVIAFYAEGGTANTYPFHFLLKEEQQIPTHTSLCERHDAMADNH